jgi:hypothetical protein
MESKADRLLDSREGHIWNALRRILWDGGWAWLIGLVLLKCGFLFGCLLLSSPHGPVGLIRFTLVSFIILFAPGLFVVRCFRYCGGGPLNRLLMVVGLSLSMTVAAVFSLYVTGFYYRSVLLFLLGCSALLGLIGVSSLHPRQVIRSLRSAWMAEGWLERLSLIFWSLFFVGAIEASIGRPITAWDAIVSWDKWGCDMADRHFLGTYVMGGYPQFIPSLYSIFYKLAGSTMEGYPDEQLLLHGFIVIFPLLLFLGTIRLCRLLDVPWPPAVFFLLGSRIVLTELDSGYVDVPAMSLYVMALALILGFLKKEWEFERSDMMSWLAVAFFLFAAGFVKGHGLIWIGLLISYVVVHLLRRGELRAALPFLGGALTLLFLLLVPFYAHQQYLSHHPDSVETDPRLHSLFVVMSRPDLIHCSFGNAAGKIDEFFQNYMTVFPPWLLAAVSVLLMAISLRTSSVWLCLTMAAALAACWYFTSSYDWRNLLPALPLFAVAIAGGIPMLGRWFRHQKYLIPLMSLAVIAMFSGRLVCQKVLQWPDVLRLCHGEAGGLWAVPRGERLRAMGCDGWRILLNGAPMLKAATHVYVSDPYYRHLGHRGIYLLDSFSLTERTPGDVMLWAKEKGFLSDFTPLCAVRQPMWCQALCLYRPSFRLAEYSIKKGGSKEIPRGGRGDEIVLPGMGGYELRIESLQDLAPGDSAAVELECAEQNEGVTMELSPDLARVTTLGERFLSVWQGHSLRFFFWLNRTDGGLPCEVLLRIENGSTNSLVVRRVLVAR